MIKLPDANRRERCQPLLCEGGWPACYNRRRNDAVCQESYE